MCFQPENTLIDLGMEFQCRNFSENPFTKSHRQLAVRMTRSRHQTNEPSQEHPNLKTKTIVEPEPLPQEITRLFVIADLLSQKSTDADADANDNLKPDNLYPASTKSFEMKSDV